MGSKKIYYTDKESESELQAYKNVNGELFISLTADTAMEEIQFIALDKEDAIALISELAFEFDLVNDDLEYPRPMWEGNPR